MKRLVVTGGIFGLTGVALGAFGSHGLEGKLSEELLKIYNTGILYHLIHAAVITAIGLSSDEKFKISGLFFSIGVILFSFSLYIYSITEIRSLVFVTPVGGASFLLGWFFLIIKGLSKKKHE